LNVYSYIKYPIIIIVYTAEVVGGRLAAGDETLEARCYRSTAIPWTELAFPSTAEALRDFLAAASQGKQATWC